MNEISREEKLQQGKTEADKFYKEIKNLVYIAQQKENRGI